MRARYLVLGSTLSSGMVLSSYLTKLMNKYILLSVVATVTFKRFPKPDDIHYYF